MKKLKKLPDSELKVMMLIWDNTPPVARNILSDQLDVDWTKPTVLKLLSRLVNKGYLSCEKQGNKNMYTPLISKEEYLADESIAFAKKLENVSLIGLMSALVETRGITKEEVEELEKIIEQYRDSSEK